MNAPRHVSSVLICLIICTILAVGLSAYTFYAYITTAQRELSSIEASNTTSLNKSITIINEMLKDLIKVSAQLADQAAGVIGNEAAYQTLSTDMKTALNNYPAILDISVSYEPYEFTKEKRLHSVQFIRKTSTQIDQVSIETWYDYTTAPWYTVAKTMESSWVDPLYDASLQKTVTTYVVPILQYNQEKHTNEFIGVFAIDIAVDYLDNLLESVELLNNSYTMLVTKNGTILVHPADEYAQQSATLFDLTSKPGNKAFINLGNTIARELDGEMMFTLDNNASHQYKAIFSTIPHVNWVIIIIGPAKANTIPTIEIRHLLIHLMLSLILLCTCLVALIFRIHRGNSHSLWLTSSACSVFILMGIIAIWAFDIISVENHTYHSNIVNSEIALSQFLNVQKKTNPLFYKHHVHIIPTGLYLYAVTLEATNPNMTVNGHIWQKYNIKEDKDLLREVIVFNAMEQSMDKVYDTTEGDIQTIGWRFSAKIKGNFDYTKYPFDQQNLMFALGNKDYVQNVVLVPDFAAFTGMHSKHPEIDPITNTSPWVIGSTYSFYQLTQFDTNFGISGYTHQTGFPTLCFNIAVHRNSLYPFIGSILPIAIILLVAFSILIIIGLSKQNSDLASLVLSLNSGLLFATILSHQTFQRSIEASQFPYFEYLYFLIYGIILLITVNGLLYALNRGGLLINYNHNIMARLIFWPMTLGIFLVTTLIFFY